MCFTFFPLNFVVIYTEDTPFLSCTNLCFRNAGTLKRFFPTLWACGSFFCSCLGVGFGLGVFQFSWAAHNGRPAINALPCSPGFCLVREGHSQGNVACRRGATLIKRLCPTPILSELNATRYIFDECDSCSPVSGSVRFILLPFKPRRGAFLSLTIKSCFVSWENQSFVQYVQALLSLLGEIGNCTALVRLHRLPYLFFRAGSSTMLGLLFRWLASFPFARERVPGPPGPFFFRFTGLPEQNHESTPFRPHFKNLAVFKMLWSV